MAGGNSTLMMRQWALLRTTALVGFAGACGVPVGMIALPGAAMAQVWQGPGSDWNTGTNWSTGTAPNSALVTATFGNLGPTAVSTSSTTAVDGIVFNAGAAGYTITLGQTFSVENAGVINNSGVTQNFSVASGQVMSFSGAAGAGTNVVYTTLGSGGVQFSGSGSAADASFALGSGSIYLNSPAPISLGSVTGVAGSRILATAIGTSVTLGALGATETFGGRIEEDAGVGLTVTKTGTGTLTLTDGAAASNFTGLTTVAQGTLNIQAATALGSAAAGTVVTGGATLALQGGITVANEALTLNGTGVGDGGALRNVAGNNSFGGAVTLNSASRINSDAGTMTLSGGIGGAAQGLTFGGAGNISVTGAIATGAAAVTKDGTGTLSLAAANSYSGGTDLNGGTIQLGNNAALGTGMLRISDGTVRAGVADLTIANNIDISVGAAFDTNGHTLTLAGVISNGLVGKEGAGTLVLSNANTFSGLMGLTGGTVRAANNAALGTSVLVMGDGTTLQSGVAGLTLANAIIVDTGTSTFDTQAFATKLTGVIGGVGTLNKIGAGTLKLSAINTYTGPTVVNAGTLSVDGSIASSAMTTVNAGGTLGGTGTVGNTTINGGTLAPGNSIGTLTVQGNLVLTAASRYMIEVSPVNADRVNVTGTATLGGTTVNASFAPGSYVTRQYTIVNATGGVNGTFGTQVTTDLPSNFTSKLSYDANNAYLDLALSFTPPVPAGPTLPSYVPLNTNQANVGNALVGFFNRTGGIPLVFGALDARGLSQVSGETATGSQRTTFDAMNLFMGLITDPFTAGRGDVAGAVPFANETMSYAAKRKPSDALAAIYRKAPPMAPAFQERWNVWVAGFGGARSSDGNAVTGSNNTTSNIYATAVGADYWFSPNTVAGFALAGGGTNFSVASGGSGRSDLFQAGAFVRHTMGSAYITATAAYGWQDITTDRNVTVAGFSQLRAQFNASSYAGRIEAGNRFVMPWMGGVGLTPYAAAQVIAFDLPSYAETTVAGANTFALAYAGKTATGTRSELGFRADKSFAVDTAILTLRGRAAWAHDYNPDRNIGATFQALPGASFVVNGATQGRNAALTTASAEVKWTNGWAVAATFEGEFSDVTRSYSGKGVVRYAW